MVRGHGSKPKPLTAREVLYQVSFKANWICREGVSSNVIWPTEELAGVPSGFRQEFPF
jgi:hypothetical protein